MNVYGALLAQENAGIANIVLMVAVFGGLIFMLIVPQRKQRKQQQELINSLEVGDGVVTAGGMFGTISYMEGDEVHLEVDTDVVIRISKGSISRLEGDPDPDAKSPSK